MLLAVAAFAAEVPVEITSSKQGLEVSRLEGLQQVPLCTAPCSLQLDEATPSLRVSGRGLTSATVPLVLVEGEPVHIHVRPGSKGASTLGSLFGLATVGLVIGSTASFATAEDKTAAGAAAGCALLSGLIAWPLVSVGKTRVKVTPVD